MEFIAPPLLELGDHGAVHNGRSIIRLCALLHHVQTPEPTLHALTVQHETENRTFGGEGRQSAISRAEGRDQCRGKLAPSFLTRHTANHMVSSPTLTRIRMTRLGIWNAYLP